MKVDRARIGHHLVGIATAVTAIAGLFQIFSIGIFNDPKLINDDVRISYLAYKESDIVGLFRVGAHKALSSDSNVKLGYRSAQICQNISNDVRNIRIQYADRSNVNINDRWGMGHAQVLTASNKIPLEEYCDTINSGWVISSSQKLREFAETNNEYPDIIAVGRK